MTRRGAHSPRWLPWATGALCALFATVVGCSSDDPTSGAATTSTTQPSTTQPPTNQPSTTQPGATGPGADEPLPVAWVTQVGGTGNDVLSGLVGRNETVVSVGATDTGIEVPTSTGGDSVVVVVGAADGKVSSLNQSGTAGSDAADAVGSGDNAALACGKVTTPGLRVGGSVDTPFCSPIDASGSLGAIGSAFRSAVGTFAGVALSPARSYGFATGSVVGAFPSAQDPFGSALGGEDAVIVRINEKGEPTWARQIGTPGSDRGEAVALSDDGDGVVTGTSDGALKGNPIGGSDGWITRFDPYGNPRWISQFGSDAADRSHAVATGGLAARGTEVFAAAGSTDGTVVSSGPNGPVASGGGDALVAAFDSSGRQSWITQFGSPTADVAHGVVVDGSTIYVAGTTSGLIAAPATQSGDPVRSAGGRDGFLAALDTSTGRLRWVTQFGSAGDEEVTGLTRTEDGFLVVSGSTTGQVATTPPGGGTDGFLAAFELPAGGGGAASKA